MPETKRDLNSLVQQIGNRKREELAADLVQNLLHEFEESILDLDANLQRYIPGLPAWFVQEGFEASWGKVEATADRRKFLKGIADKFIGKEKGVPQALAILAALLKSDPGNAIFFLYQMERILKKKEKNQDLKKAPVSDPARKTLAKDLLEPEGKPLLKICAWEAKDDEERKYLNTAAPLLFDTFFCGNPTKSLKNNAALLGEFLDWLYSCDQLGECIARCEDRISPLIGSWPEEYRKRAQELDARLIKPETNSPKIATRDAKNGKPTPRPVISRATEESGNNSTAIHEGKADMAASGDYIAMQADRITGLGQEEPKSKSSHEIPNQGTIWAVAAEAIALGKKNAENLAILERVVGKILEKSKYDDLVRQHEALQRKCYQLDDELSETRQKIKELTDEKAKSSIVLEDLRQQIKNLGLEKGDLENRLQAAAEDIRQSSIRHKDNLERLSTRHKNDVAHELQTLREKIALALKAEYENGRKLTDENGVAKIIIANIFSELAGLGVDFGSQE